MIGPLCNAGARLRALAALALCVLPLCELAAAAELHDDQERARVLVLTDIGNEPDDSESMVRFLLYANEFDVEGLVATTSTWQRQKIRPDLIEERIQAYGTVLPNLRQHASGYPEATALLKLVRNGAAKYGMDGVTPGNRTDASQLIIAAVDKSDSRPLWLSIWGGARELAQALSDIRATRTPDAVNAFVAKLRVYSISDQDDAGPWIRRNFPDLFWIASIHAFNQYGMAAWPGISGSDATREGSDPSLVSHEWLDRHIRKGPLGSLYPQWQYIMEGDTPAFLYLLPNGLGVPERPDYGSWGGRYEKVSAADGLYADTVDIATGIDGKTWRSNKATIWRWREAYQNDFAARMQWTLAKSRKDANHAPEIVVNATAGSAPLTMSLQVGGQAALDAAGSHDPDGDTLRYRWFEYREINPAYAGVVALKIEDAAAARTTITVPATATAGTRYHVILEVRDSGNPFITRYRRIIVDVRRGPNR